ncbi:MAG: hypothetical protein CL868_10045 [Cytophagaceae bacterium]|nr:hypothetical protein [Cytophagaceae bacterium]
MKKLVILGVLFILPIVAYLFFASGVHNFAKLPVLTEQVEDIDFDPSISMNDKITVLGFLGGELVADGGTLFNLNQKIYKYFSEFKDFQFVFLVSNDMDRESLDKVTSELEAISNLDHWHFVFAERQQMESVFNSLKTPYTLDHDYTPYVFLIDKNMALRGRDDDEDVQYLYGYNAEDAAEMSNKMKDDVKILLAEYRLALKKNNADRQK